MCVYLRKAINLPISFTALKLRTENEYSLTQENNARRNRLKSDAYDLILYTRTLGSVNSLLSIVSSVL
jgi:hypothetical protein